MRRIVSTGAIALLVFGWAGSARAADDTDPRAIIDRAIKATGGEEVLAKIKAETWKEKGTFYGMGDGIPFEGSYSLQFPNQFKMAIENFATFVVNGDKGWMNDAEMNADQIADFKAQCYISWLATLVPLKDPAFTLTALDEIKVADQPAVGVKVTHAGHPDIKLYFDKKTGLLVKDARRAKNEEGKEVDAETILSGHKNMDGVMMATKLLVNRDGKKFVEAEVIDWKISDKLDDKVFAKP
jgi:hypothetical protein